jgi:glyoxylase-like metal-dependent hydrolase (beta-lactamase superfamily II)
MTRTPTLPTGMTVLERGWLSANNVVFRGPQGNTLVDSGYCSHSAQTLALVANTLQGEPLHRLVNTHLHSDHCGGNAALQAHYHALQTWIPPGEAGAVQAWRESDLSYRRTGQSCPRFQIQGVLQPGTELSLGAGTDTTWEVHAAPGHDPNAVLLYHPGARTLVSGDALWENGFGVVFPELEGQAAFEEVANTLDLIEKLAPQVVVPGHGRVFGGNTEVVAQALARARSRLAQFRQTPEKHTLYAAKVLIKFKLMEWQRITLDELLQWAQTTPYVTGLHATLRPGPEPGLADWLHTLLQDLQRSGAARLEGRVLIDGPA